MDHPLHLAVAEEIRWRFEGRFDDIIPRAAEATNFPLFVGRRKGRDTRMCCVDLLVLESDTVRVIVEIE